MGTAEDLPHAVGGRRARWAVCLGATLLLYACGTPRVESAYRLDSTGLTASESRWSQGSASCLSNGAWRYIVVHLDAPVVGRVYDIGSPALRACYGARNAADFDAARGSIRVVRLEPESLILELDVELLLKGRVIDRLREQIEFGLGRVRDEDAPGLQRLEPAK